MAEDIIIKRGDSRRIDLVFERPDEEGVYTPVDIRASLVTFTVKDSFNTTDDSALVNKTSEESSEITITDGEEGKARVFILPSDTEDVSRTSLFFYDVQLLEQDGTKSTAASGKFIVQEDIAWS